VIQDWLKAIEGEKTLIPHSILRRAVLECTDTAESPDFEGWLKHAEETLS
jgi:hypothetical protein